VHGRPEPCLSAVATASSMGVKTPPVKATRVATPPWSMHLSALRSDCSNYSSYTAVSFGGSGERTSDPTDLYPAAVQLSSIERPGRPDPSTAARVERPLGCRECRQPCLSARSP